MKLKNFLQIVGLLFGAKVIFGIFYLLLGWQVSVSGWVFPSWLIIVAVVADAYLAYTAYKLVK